MQGSLLFQPQTQPEEPIRIEDSLLFSQSQPHADPDSPLQFTQAPPEQNVSENRPEGSKEVKLFNGKKIFLRRRTPQPVSVDYSDTILDMDKLHEQVEKRRTTRDAINEVRRSRISEKAKLSATQTDSGIWTEKYRPKAFFSLCPAGNERHYRSIMHWLRLREKEKKVLLVHGPPGVGKTAAVHALANQAGYGVYEVNAANALDNDRGDSSSNAYSRQLAKLRHRMKIALTSNDVMCMDKPTCLVIDEVDCAANANDVVRVILEIVNSRKFKLARPIICIANDAFSGKAMEKLRPLCELVGFRRPVATARSGPGKMQRVNVSAQKTVKEYLMDISNKEGLQMDRKEIADVFETCEGDMRACINQMQFAGRRLDKALHLGKNNGNYSSKDKNVSWFALVDRLFARDRYLSKDEDALDVYDMLLSGEGTSSASLDKVIRGCFNRYLEATHFQDDSLVRPAEISDWLHYYDRFHSRPGGDPAGYSTLAPLKFWSLFSEIDPPRNHETVIVPNAKSLDFETMELNKQNKSILMAITENLPISLKLSCSASSDFYACQFLPMLDIMLSPNPGSSRVKLTLRVGEQRLVERAAHIVKLLGLRLETLKNMETGSVSLAFGPNWDSITIFETDSAPVLLTQKSKLLNTKRNWLFPLLQAEFDLTMAQRVKRVALRVAPTAPKPKRPRKQVSAPDFFLRMHLKKDTLGESKGPNGEEAKSQEGADGEGAKSQEGTDGEEGKSQEGAEAKSQEGAEAKSQEDANGEVAGSQEDDNPEQSRIDQEAEKSARIWVKFNEGFSNAVRKNIGWVDLWA